MADDAAATFDLPIVLRFSELAVAALGEAREEIDALNVYPVPDGDTGTNMFLTLEAARSAMLDALGGDAESPVARRPPHGAGGVRPRRPARGARQLRGDPVPAHRGALQAAGRGRSRRPVGAGVRRGNGVGHRGQLRRGRATGRGDHPVGRQGRLRGGGSVRRGPRPPARSRDPRSSRRRPRGAGPHAGPAAGAPGRRGRRRRGTGAVRRARRRRDRRDRTTSRVRATRRSGPTRSRCRCPPATSPPRVRPTR